MNNLVDIKFHGALGKVLNRDFKLSVGSVQEALGAVDVVSGRKLTKYFMKGDNFNKEYRILVNGKDIASENKKIDTVEKIYQSELPVQRSTLKTIDVVPVVEGSDSDILSIVIIIVAVALIAFGGYVALPSTFGVGGLGATAAGISAGAFIVAGLALLVAGVSNLLAKPPEFEEFKDNSKSGVRSYLFNGPANVIGEGGAVPFGYGRLLVGSQTIDTTYEVTYRDVDEYEITA